MDDLVMQKQVYMIEGFVYVSNLFLPGADIATAWPDHNIVKTGTQLVMTIN
jgi:hypothetical protein